MAQETEIKLRIDDAKALLRALKRLGAQVLPTAPGRVHEQNVIFDTPQGGLAKHGQLLRVRTESLPGPAKRRGSATRRRTVLTFKRPPASSRTSPEQMDTSRHHKVREEFEVEVADAASLAHIFEGLGMSGWFRYEKYRTTYRLARARWAENLLLELDETPIGTFLELEGPPEAIDRAARELGYSRHDYILKNYLTLYVEDCRKRGEEPRYMLFDLPDTAPRAKKLK